MQQESVSFLKGTLSMFNNPSLLIKYILSFAVFALLHTITLANVQSFNLVFYGQTLEFEYEEEMLYPYDIKVEELALRQAYERLDNRSVEVLLNAIQRNAAQLQLNDWLYIELIRACSQHIYGERNFIKSELTSYLLLGKSGYDVRLTYRKDLVHINVFVEEVLYEVPLIEENGRQYANVSKSKVERNTGQSMYLLDHQANPQGKHCSFSFNRWPAFCDRSTTRQVSFTYKGQVYELDISYSKEVAGLLNNYPLVDEYWYMLAPLSHQLKETLIPQLKEMIKGRSIQSSLELLVAFTRSGFQYKEDNAAFGKSKPMVADELFYYAFSDCEDRSALFFSLVKELLDLPMIVIAYEDHLSIAVASQGLMGSAVMYNGKRFIFCDPTGPSMSSAIGKVPEGYEGKDFKILGSYNSQ